jgi:hypothetical protein
LFGLILSSFIFFWAQISTVHMGCFISCACTLTGCCMGHIIPFMPKLYSFTSSLFIMLIDFYEYYIMLFALCTMNYDFLHIMFILWIKLNQRDICFGEFMLSFVLWRTTYVELWDNVLFTSAQRWYDNIFLIWGILFYYVILLNDYIFISAQRWCENIFLINSYVNQFNIGLHTILMCIKP